MYVKLHNPHTKQVLVFAANGEVYYEPAGKLTQSQQDKLIHGIETEGIDDARRFAIWAQGGDKAAIDMTRIWIPAAAKSKSRPQQMLTNWDAYLCSDTGKTLERIHRHAL